MIRYIYINNLVLNVYINLPKIQFPINTQEIIKLIPNTRYLSYQQFAQINNCTIDEVIRLCESKSGCSYYDVSKNRYLILCNQSTDNNNNIGRQRWTCSHEIGHILCGHHKFSAKEMLSENSLLPHTKNKNFESEADYFAATLLAPFPLFNVLNIKSTFDIQNTFGLSCEASLYRFKQYLKWKNNHRKTAWENDIKYIFQHKSNYL